MTDQSRTADDILNQDSQQAVDSPKQIKYNEILLSFFMSHTSDAELRNAIFH